MSAKLLIALCVLACFVAATPSCSLLNNEKDQCTASSSQCTWTDVSADSTCKSGCVQYPKVDTDCTSTNGCAFTASNCAAKITCLTASKADCTTANNCVYTAEACSVNPNAKMSCNDNAGVCLDTLPAYCTSTPTSNCAPLATPTATCPSGLTDNTKCISPCPTATPIENCISICPSLSTDDCVNATYSPFCVITNGACTTIATTPSCGTLSVNCADNAQCTVNTTYNCETATNSVKTYCSTTAGTACGTAQTSDWCGTTTTNICAVNDNYCVLGAYKGNGCGADYINCLNTAASCATKDANACVQSTTAPTCNTDYCTGSFATCKTSAAAGCSIATATTCTTNDASCIFNAGGTCSINSSGTNGYIIAFCSSLLAFVLIL